MIIKVNARQKYLKTWVKPLFKLAVIISLALFWVLISSTPAIAH